MSNQQGVEAQWGAAADCVVQHMHKHVGVSKHLVRDASSGKLPITIYCIAPTSEDPCWTLFTVGMSALSMRVPSDFTGPDRAELCLRLPSDWQFTTTADGTPTFEGAGAWPLRWLRMLARLPHDMQTWLWSAHSIPNGNPAQPLAADSALCGMLIVPPLCLDEAAETITTPVGTVAMLGVVPITAAEMQCKLTEGFEVLLEKLNAGGVDDVVAPSRASVV